MEITITQSGDLPSILNSVLEVLAGGFVGFVTAVFSDVARNKLFGPRILLEFGQGDCYQTPTPEYDMHHDVAMGTHQAKYFRIKALNKGRYLANTCRAYLVAIEKRNTNGVFENTQYCDSIPLAWSCRQPTEYDPIDLPRDIEQFIDLVSIRDTSADFRIHTKVDIARYRAILHDQGTFRFTVQVSGHNVPPSTIRVEFTWARAWGSEAAATSP